MLSYTRRPLFASSLLLLAALGPSADAAESKTTAKQIAQWVEELGDTDFKVRENASKKLWQAGAAAETALEKAIQSSDPEVVRRARELLDKFQWGIYPDTPAGIVALIRAYQSSEGEPRLKVLQKLLDSGDAGLRAVSKIAAAEKDVNSRKELGDLVVNKLSAGFLLAATEDKYESFERLLELGHEGKFIGHNRYAAYWLLRGKLAERIVHFRTRLNERPENKWLAQTLTYLHRANGDLVQARKAAEKSGSADLLEGILFETGDWQALASRPDRTATEKPADEGTIYNVRAENLAEKWAYRAAYARLAGKQEDFENAVRELQKCPEGKADRNALAFVAAKGLLLNDRPDKGLELLRSVTVPERRALLFDVLCARLEFGVAIDLAVKEDIHIKEVPSLSLARARLLCLLGEKKGEALFDQYAERMKDEVDPNWINSLLAEEMRAGLKDRALIHAAKALKALSVAQPKSWRDFDKETPARRFLAQLFPKQEGTFEVWWTMRRLKFKDASTESIQKSLQHLRDLMEGRISAKEVKELIAEAEIQWAGSSLLPSVRESLAEVAAKADLDDLAYSVLEKAATRDALIRLGDLFAAKKQWTKAAERYLQAWKKVWHPETLPLPKHSQGTSGEGPLDPLPLYLAGDALVRAGQEQEGKKLIEQAHWIPFADAETRYDFIRALSERGHKEAARRETELLLRVSEPNTYYSGAAIRRLAFAALARKDYHKAAVGFEQSMMRCFNPYTHFVENAAYATVPAQIHHLRASALLAEGKLEQALQHVERALAASPGYANLPIELVPELERRGHKKEAADLFNRCYGTYEKVCRAYPRCAWAHNSAAWLSACCRRNLDPALDHAEKAVALAPDHAGYLDTLAEVHFQRGNKDKAIAVQKRAIELNPKKAYYRKQLKRIQAGDPSAPRPAENDAE